MSSKISFVCPLTFQQWEEEQGEALGFCNSREEFHSQNLPLNNLSNRNKEKNK